jgi:hypothetical protein
MVLASDAAFAADDELCGKLTDFETASFDQTGQEKARWIEMHWRGSWLNFETGWGIACLSSDDDAAKRLCQWLPKQVSYEFADSFPRRILACHGYNLPQMQEWKSRVELWDGEDRFHYLLIDFATLEGEAGAVRYVSVSDDATDPEIENHELEAMPPLGANDR